MNLVYEIKSGLRKQDSELLDISKLLDGLDFILDTINKDNIQHKERIKILEWQKQRLINRRKMQLKVGEDADGVVHKFCVGGSVIGTGYLLTYNFSDGSIGSLTLKMKNDVSGLVESDTMLLDYKELFSSYHSVLDLFCRCVSVGLRYGVPLQVYIEEFIHCRFAPQGMTRNSDIPIASSIIDYLMKYLAGLSKYQWRKNI